MVECKEYNSSNYIGLFIGKIRNQDFCSKKQIKGNYKVGLDSLELIAEFKKLSYNFDEQLNYDVKVNTNLHFQKVTKLKQEFYSNIPQFMFRLDYKAKYNSIITKINNSRVKNSAYLKYLLFKHSPGDTITVTYNRNGKEATTKIKLTKNENI